MKQIPAFSLHPDGRKLGFSTIIEIKRTLLQQSSKAKSRDNFSLEQSQSIVEENLNILNSYFPKPQIILNLSLGANSAMLIG